MKKLKYIADFHIHSRFSIATSKKLIPEYLEYWARIKGINLIGTGDCIHPGWSAGLKEKLEPCENGLFRLKKEYRLPESAALNTHDNIPAETEKHKGICPVCNTPVTPGVMHRVAELADRDMSEIKNTHDFYSITQLPDLLAELAGCKSSSAAKVTGEYFRLIKSLGSEFHILLDAEQGEIGEKG